MVHDICAKIIRQCKALCITVLFRVSFRNLAVGKSSGNSELCGWVSRPLLDSLLLDERSHANSLQPPQLTDRLAIPRAFGKDLAPQPRLFIEVPALLGQRSQVAPGEMPVNPHIDAREFLRPPQLEYPPPARLSLGRLGLMAMNHPLAEPELGVLRIKPQPLTANPQRLGGGWCHAWFLVSANPLETKSRVEMWRGWLRSSAR